MQPMLAGDLKGDLSKVRYPLLGSPKLDGIRVIIKDGAVLSRNLKPIPNKHTQKLFCHSRLNGLDGELIVGNPRAADCFRATTSGVMSVEGEPAVALHVFDHFGYPAEPYHQRALRAYRVAKLSMYTVYVAQTIIQSEQALLSYEDDALRCGYEGIMLRAADAPYKHGRGTVSAQDLMKLKRFEDAEAVVIGVEEQMANNNTLERDAFGYAKRSTKKAGLLGKNTLGTLRVEAINGPYRGKVFNVGTGFSDALRDQLWAEHMAGTTLLKRIVKFRHFPSGTKDAPRFPVFVGFRNQGDMS